MTSFFDNLIRIKIPSRIVFAIVVFILLQITASSYLIYFILINQTKDSLLSLSKRIVSDVQYENGKWNLSKYNSDPNIPEIYPLYIITLDGTVIDRNNPIQGFLDKSRIALLDNYFEPRTIHTITNGYWRIYSKPIVSNGNTIGIISLSIYNPDLHNIATLDNELKKSADLINSQIRIQHGKIVVKYIDVRQINYGITIEIVDQFNSILLKTSNINSINRSPDYIDRSYVGYDLSLPAFLQVNDMVSNEPFLIYNNRIKDRNGNNQAIVVIGRSIGYIYQAIVEFILFESVIGLILLTLFLFFVNVSLKKSYSKLIQQTAFEQAVIKRIAFLKNDSKLLINDIIIPVPYATNQYYFCVALFSNPSKRWETDELLEKFGEHDFTKWHKVYDSMKTMNNRVTHILSDKLFILKNKTYQINPIYRNLIS